MRMQQIGKNGLVYRTVGIHGTYTDCSPHSPEKPKRCLEGSVLYRGSKESSVRIPQRETPQGCVQGFCSRGTKVDTIYVAGKCAG
jgi:hypothetical protein